MIIQPRLIRPFTQKIDKAITLVAKRYGQGFIADEDDFTSRLLERIQTEVDNWNFDENKILFQAKKTTWRGRGSEEAILGADIVVTVNIDLRDYKTSKGILIQAKCLDRGKSFDPSAWSRLCRQISKMEIYTLDSYVWLYDSSGVRSIRARAVMGLQTRRPDDLYITRCSTFLGEFIQSKHGDPLISDVTNLSQILYKIREIPERFPFKYVLSFSISENDREHDRIS